MCTCRQPGPVLAPAITLQTAIPGPPFGARCVHIRGTVQGVNSGKRRAQRIPDPVHGLEGEANSGDYIPLILQTLHPMGRDKPKENAE